MSLHYEALHHSLLEHDLLSRETDREVVYEEEYDAFGAITSHLGSAVTAVVTRKCICNTAASHAFTLHSLLTHNPDNDVCKVTCCAKHSVIEYSLSSNMA